VKSLTGADRKWPRCTEDPTNGAQAAAHEGAHNAIIIASRGRLDGTIMYLGLGRNSYKYNIKLLYAKTVVRVAVEVRQAM
jgi:hypothetical protein